MIWPFKQSKKAKAVEAVLQKNEEAKQRLDAALRESRKLLFGEELLTKQRDNNASND